MQRYVEDWNRGDTRAMAALFGKEAEFVSSLGYRASGRSGIEELFADMIGKGVFKGTKADVTIEQVRLLSPNVGRLSCSYRILDRSGRPLRNGYMTGVVMREDERWLFQAFQATPVMAQVPKAA
jgi:uncharacterized protein (TIGR02246 family)